MRSINQVILIGNVSRDPELRQTANGQQVTTFTIATNRTWMAKDGRKETGSEYHDVVAWAKLAELAKQHVKKGKLVYIKGYLKTRSWDTREGTKKSKTEVIIDDLILLGKRQDYEEIGEREHRAGEREHRAIEEMPFVLASQ